MENDVIESYSFGRMTIAGTDYTRDLIILPDREVVHPWWRQSGHELILADLEPVIAAKPVILVVGTGKPGMMRAAAELESQLAGLGIILNVAPTAQAAGQFNSLARRGERSAGCFHLTC